MPFDDLRLPQVAFLGWILSGEPTDLYTRTGSAVDRSELRMRCPSRGEGAGAALIVASTTYTLEVEPGRDRPSSHKRAISTAICRTIAGLFTSDPRAAALL